VEPPGGEAGRHLPPLDDGISVYYRLTAGGKKVRFLDLKTRRAGPRWTGFSRAPTS